MSQSMKLIPNPHQRRLERLTYHQQINCKRILRLRNGKEQKGGF
jgi:hypothetical protein